MEVRYTDGPEALNVEPKDGNAYFTAERGVWVEVSDSLGKRLLEQGWESKTKNTKAPSAKSEKE